MIPVQKIYDATRQGLDIILWIYPQAADCVGVKGKKFKVNVCSYKGKSYGGLSPLYKKTKKIK